MKKIFLIVFIFLFLLNIHKIQSQNTKKSELITKQIERTLTGHTEPVLSVAISPDGSKIVSGSRDHTLKIWNLQTNVLLQTNKEHTKTIRSIAITSDGSKIVSGSDDNTIKIWSLSTGKLLQTIKGHTDAVRSIALSADGTKIISGSNDKTIKIWNLSTGALLRTTIKGIKHNIESIAVDTSHIVSAEGEEIKVWKFSTGALLKTIPKLKNSARAVAILSGTKIVSAIGNDIKIWNIFTGDLLQTIPDKSQGVNSVAVTPDGAMIISGSYDNTIKIWNSSNDSLLQTLSGHTNSVLSVATDGKKIVSGSSDKTIKVWNLEPDLKTKKANAPALKDTLISKATNNNKPDSTNSLVQLKLFSDWSETKKQDSARKTKEIIPPDLVRYASFTDPSGNNKLDAEETGEIKYVITNRGKGIAHHVKTNVNLTESQYTEFNYNPDTFKKDEIKPGDSCVIKIPIRATIDIPNKDIVVNFISLEKNGFNTTPLSLTFKTKEFYKPQMIFVGNRFTDESGNSQIEQTEPTTIKFSIKNIGMGNATKVLVTGTPGENNFRQPASRESYYFDVIKTDEQKDIEFTIFSNKKAKELILNVVVSEEKNLFGFAKTIRYPINVLQEYEVIKIKSKEDVVKEISTDQYENTNEILASIPEAASLNLNAYAVIIGIKDYQNGISSIDYAKQDAYNFREYAKKTLGIPSENIYPKSEHDIITSETFKSYIKTNLINDIGTSKKSEIYIYFSGQALSGKDEGKLFQPNPPALFLLTDSDINNISRNNTYYMEDFLSDVKKIPAIKKIIIIDAPYSGALINNIPSEGTSPEFEEQSASNKNILFFLATQKEQTAQWYNEKRQGMFTYFFLKGLQGDADKNKDKRITAEELETFINNEEVGLPRSSKKIAGRLQVAKFFYSKNIPIAIIK